jgi:hypothetical protein
LSEESPSACGRGGCQSEIPEEAIAQLANILFSVEEISEGEAEEITETGEFAEETEDEDKQ